VKAAPHDLTPFYAAEPKGRYLWENFAVVVKIPGRPRKNSATPRAAGWLLLSGHALADPEHYGPIRLVGIFPRWLDAHLAAFDQIESKEQK